MTTLVNSDALTIPEATDEVTLADVIEPKKMYRVQFLQDQLGIDQATVARGYHKHRGAIFTDVHGPAPALHAELRGSQILRWIEADGIPFQISPGARHVVLRQRRIERERLEAEAAAIEARERPKDLIGKALKHARDVAESDARANADAIARDWSLYTAILRRHVAGKPRDGDDRELSDFMRDYDIHADQIREDIRTVERADELRKLHGEVEQANQARVKARAAHVALMDRQKQEKDDAEKLKRTTERHHLQCSGAHAELDKLAKRRPGLFTIDGGLPMLRSPAEIQQETPKPTAKPTLKKRS